MIYIRDFKTQNSETFQDPRTHIDDADMLEDAIEEERKEWESKRQEQRERHLKDYSTLESIYLMEEPPEEVRIQS